MYPNVEISCKILVNETCLQCFDAVGWAAGRASSLQKLSGGVLAWLSVLNEVPTCMAQLISMQVSVFCFSEIQIGFTFLVPAYPASPDKGPLNGRMYWLMRDYF